MYPVAREGPLMRGERTEGHSNYKVPRIRFQKEQRRSLLTRIVAPQRWLRERLAQLEVQAPMVDWQAIDNGLPWHEYSRLARRIVPPARLDLGDPFCRFGPFVNVENVPDYRRLDMRDMFGICASKSHIVPLAELSQTASIDDILAERDVKVLIDEVLYGSIDCVARAGQPVDVREQVWDGRLYVSNDGGSHRFAAIWRWHREQGQPLMKDCAVRGVSLAAGTVEAVASHRYWLLVLECEPEAYGILSVAGVRSLIPDHARKGRGIPLRFLDSDFVGGGQRSPECCIAYPRNHPLAEVLDEWLEASPALDLSEVILKLAGR
jgi:hypothetical protein